MHKSRRALILAAVLALPLAAAGCSLVPAGAHASLAPTLAFQDKPGGPVAFQSGQPVPTFDRQSRLRADLDGTWRFQAHALATSLSLADRKAAIKAITAELGTRADASFDDSSWATLDVPGTFNMPPNRGTTAGYYRRDFFVSPAWAGRYVMLKFGAVRYVADVWLNGQYLGYHEGGDTPFALDASSALLAGAVDERRARGRRATPRRRRCLHRDAASRKRQRQCCDRGPPLARPGQLGQPAEPRGDEPRAR
jgi:hypothetical protein